MIVLANGLIVLEANYLYSDLIADNPVVPMNMAICSYNSIDGNGAFVGLKRYIGSDITFDKLIPMFSGSRTPLFKSVTPITDYVYTYTLTSGDISALGNKIEVSGFLLNNINHPATWEFSADQGSLTAGDAIFFTGLLAVADTNSITFNLQSQ